MAAKERSMRFPFSSQSVVVAIVCICLYLPIVIASDREPGTSVGGFVKNEKGEFIKGVTIHLRAICADRSPHYEAKTDSKGYWQCDNLPVKVNDIRIWLTHADYISDETYGIRDIRLETLRSMTSVAVMEKGLPVIVKVLDLNGNPVERANISFGKSSFLNWKGETDAEGMFFIKRCRDGENTIAVEADGYAPDINDIVLTEDAKPIVFRLGPGHTIRGIIVDYNENPIEKMWVSVQSWRKHHFIKWHTQTDSAGRFEWNDAPPDEVTFDMSTENYPLIDRVTLYPSNKEFAIEVYIPPQISGKVIDANGGEPINDFKMIPGFKSNKSDTISWFRRSPTTFTQGSYKLQLKNLFDERQLIGEYFVCIEADGYLPVVSQVFTEDNNDTVYNFKLEKAANISGTVYLPDGKPAADAEVLLETEPEIAISINNGLRTRYMRNRYVKVDSAGRFSFPPQVKPFTLLVLHDKGYAEITQAKFKDPLDITIEPWGRLEGVFYIGGQPAPNKTIICNRDTDGRTKHTVPYVLNRCGTVTDSNGAFVFDKLLSGKRRVTCSDTGQSELVDIKTGETASVTIGGIGRSVIARVVIPTDFDEPIHWDHLNNNLSLIIPSAPFPENFDEMTEEERRKWNDWRKKVWYKTWKETDEYKAYRKQRQHYKVYVQEDGTFLVEDVEAGKYNLHIGTTDKIGLLDRNFEVPVMEDGWSEEPLDIGTVELVIEKSLGVGDLATTFEFEDLDGNISNLADYKGKVVLLIFYLDPDSHIKATTDFKNIYATFSENEQFVMFSLSIYYNSVINAEFVEQNELKWIYGFVREASTETVREEYSSGGFPNIFVIGPDGRILAIDHFVNVRLESALYKALGM